MGLPAFLSPTAVPSPQTGSGLDLCTTIKELQQQQQQIHTTLLQGESIPKTTQQAVANCSALQIQTPSHSEQTNPNAARAHCRMSHLAEVRNKAFVSKSGASVVCTMAATVAGRRHYKARRLFPTRCQINTNHGVRCVKCNRGGP